MRGFFMKKLLFVIASLFLHLDARPVRVTLYNKSNEALHACIGTKSSGCEKLLMNPRQNKLFVVPDITEMQPAYVTIENKNGYWPVVYELKLLEPAELVLKRDSLVVSRKILAPQRKVRAQNQVVQRASPAAAVKIAYYGKKGCGKHSIAGQEIGFM